MAATAEGNTVHVRAPGKINLLLRVGAPQSDGYHEIATAYQAVGLYEELWASHARDITVAVRGTRAAGAPLGEDNLAVRAARLLAAAADYRGGADLVIEKNVPVAGGMGGGSADAAAALVACDALWGTGLGRDDLASLAARLGADVPFALLGGSAIGTGRGDELSPALAKGGFHWVLVFAEEGLSTAAVYAELDRLREVTPDVAAHSAPTVDPLVLQALRAGDPELLSEAMRNDLQAAALSLQPQLRGVLEAGVEAGALAGIVSGSGPTVAFLAEDAEAAALLRSALAARGFDAQRVNAPAAGARIVHEPGDGHPAGGRLGEL